MQTEIGPKMTNQLRSEPELNKEKWERWTY